MVSSSRAARSPRGWPTALVLGDIDLVRPVALAGMRSAVVAVTGDPTRFSRYATTVAIWDPDSHNDDLLEPLLAWGRAQPVRPLLYYQWDGHLLFVSRHRERLAETFRFVVDSPERVETMLDKQRFLTLAADLGLPVPPARPVLAAASSPSELADLTYPVVVKPVDRTDDRWKHFEHLGKARRIESGAQLEALWPSLVEFGRSVLFQQLIPGPESCIESYHVFVTPEGETAGEFTGRKVRTIPPEYGATTALTITDEEDVIVAGRDAVERIGLRGVAKLDFKRAPDGRLYLLEVNPRFNLWHYPGAVAGVNLPALVRDYLDGEPLPAAGTLRPRPGVTWCSPYDFATGSPGPAELLGRIRFAASSKAKAIWASDDPLPLLATAAGRITAAGRRALERA